MTADETEASLVGLFYLGFSLLLLLLLLRKGMGWVGSGLGVEFGLEWAWARP